MNRKRTFLWSFNFLFFERLDDNKILSNVDPFGIWLLLRATRKRNTYVSQKLSPSDGRWKHSRKCQFEKKQTGRPFFLFPTGEMRWTWRRAGGYGSNSSRSPSRFFPSNYRGSDRSLFFDCRIPISPPRWTFTESKEKVEHFDLCSLNRIRLMPARPPIHLSCTIIQRKWLEYYFPFPKCLMGVRTTADCYPMVLGTVSSRYLLVAESLTKQVDIVNRQGKELTIARENNIIEFINYRVIAIVRCHMQTERHNPDFGSSRRIVADWAGIKGFF